MTTYSALTTLDTREAAEALAEAIEALEPAHSGVGVFEIEDGSGRHEVGAYFEAPPDAVALALLAAAHGARPFAVSEVPETDWVAHVRRELAPVEAGRFFVYGSHDADRVPPGSFALLIEAAMAFGTGHHGTTYGCLDALETMAERPAPGAVADIGCGTAVLAMAAARVWPGVPVIASDIDPVAVEVAAANVAANRLGGRVQVVEAAGFGHPAIEAAAPFGLVFANILKGPLLMLVPEMARHVAPGGAAILSGILTGQAEEVRQAYEAGGFVAESRKDFGDWSTLVMRRRQ